MFVFFFFLFFLVWAPTPLPSMVQFLGRLPLRVGVSGGLLVVPEVPLHHSGLVPTADQCRLHCAHYICVDRFLHRSVLVLYQTTYRKLRYILTVRYNQASQYPVFFKISSFFHFILCGNKYRFT
jgi:hypothetical protein